ncbi:MAG: MotA/TolQ/ExbB proton channel family protein [Gammaproteobacteria bacterium]|nr:MotA/TolQ/ExbB proton channel family protein [Gammaproteobacteria bacterium]
MPQQDDFDKYTEKSVKSIDHAFIEATELKEPLEVVKASFELADRTHRPLLEALQTIASAIPPLKLLITSIVGIWEIIHAIFLDRETSKLSRGAKVGMTLTLIGLGIAAIVALPVAGALLVASAGVALGKELLNVATSMSAYISAKGKLSAESDPVKRVVLEKEVKAKRDKVIDNIISTTLAAASLVGFAMLITPLAPVGLGILIATSSIGIGIKLLPPLFKKIGKGISSIFQRTKNEKTATSISDDELSPQEKLKNDISPAPSLEKETTALISEIISDHPKQEVEMGLQEMHQPKEVDEPIVQSIQKVRVKDPEISADNQDEDPSSGKSFDKNS